MQQQIEELRQRRVSYWDMALKLEKLKSTQAMVELDDKEMATVGIRQRYKLYNELKGEIDRALADGEQMREEDNEDEWFHETVQHMKSEIDELELSLGRLDCVPLRIQLSNLNQAQSRYKANGRNLKDAQARYQLTLDVQRAIK